MKEYSFLRRRRRKKLFWSRLVRLLILTALACLAIFFAKSILQNYYLSNHKLIDPQPQKNVISKSLQEAVNESLMGTKGTYGIVIKNLKTGESFYLNESRIFEPASLYKLWVMATVYKQIEEGGLKEDQILSQTIPALNRIFNIDPEYAELTEGGITITVNQAIEQMITISHNYAALLLAEKIKLSSVSDFLKSQELLQSSIGKPPKTTAGDIAFFYEKLYKGQLASPENTTKMIEVLKRQQLNDGLPKLLPDATIAHKTGDLDFFKHDTGIVFHPKGDYIIVIMSESNSPLGAQQRISEISKSVYQYFETR